MSKSHALFLECFAEMRKQFPGSTPHVLKGMATRLCHSMSFVNSRTMSCDEVKLRFTQLGIALQTIPQWPGLRPGERPANAES